jgi:hypothetical protein
LNRSNRIRPKFLGIPRENSQGLGLAPASVRSSRRENRLHNAGVGVAAQSRQTGIVRVGARRDARNAASVED